MTNEDYAERLTAVEERSKSNTKRLDKIEQRQDNLDKLAESVAVIATKQDNMDGDIKEIKADVKALTLAPGKRWNFVIEKIIIAIVGAVIGALLFRLSI